MPRSTSSFDPPDRMIAPRPIAQASPASRRDPAAATNPLHRHQPDQGDRQTLYKGVYCAWGQVENHIKAWKTRLAADRTPCATPCPSGRPARHAAPALVKMKTCTSYTCRAPVPPTPSCACCSSSCQIWRRSDDNPGSHPRSPRNRNPRTRNPEPRRHPRARRDAWATPIK